MLLSQINSLTTFYLAFVVLALGASMCSNMIVSVAIIHWFEKHRARALSAVQFGSAVGGLFVFLVAWSIESFGWRITAFASGVIILAGGLPLAATIRNRPEDHHEPIDGMLPKVATGGAVGASSHRARRAFTASEALRTRAFWLLSAGHACSLFVVSAITVHAISHIKEDLGYSLAQASFYITLVTAGQFAGVICGWGIGEKYDKRKVAAACMLMHAAGMLMLTYAPNIYVLVISGLVHGMAWGLRGPFMQAIRADYFGSSSIGMIMGLSSLIMVIGQVGGPILAGALADWYGNYRLGFTILAALAGIGSIFFWMAKRPQ